MTKSARSLAQCKRGGINFCMALRTYCSINSHPPGVDEFFPRTKRDAFHEVDVLRVVQGEQWYAILITDGEKAFFHVFAPTSIPGTEWSDIDPFLGYSGPLTTTDDPAFNQRALAEYRHCCADLKIVAEVMRFNPLLNNHLPFRQTPELAVAPVKSLVICDCFTDDHEQMEAYNQSSRRWIRQVPAEFEFVQLITPQAQERFEQIYRDSLSRAGASPRWFFPRTFFAAAYQTASFSLWAVRSHLIHSVCMIIEHPLQSYYFLAASSEPRVNGTSDYLIHRACVMLAERGGHKFMLGGGNTPEENDSLLTFKRKFSRRPYTLQLGKLIHHQDTYKKLCREYEARVAASERRNYFLNYRLLPEYA